MPKEYKLRDMFLASVLKASGIKFIRAEAEGGTVIIVFCDADGRATRCAQSHMNGGVSLNSTEFERALKQVKDIIFTERRNKGLERR